MWEACKAPGSLWLFGNCTSEGELGAGSARFPLELILKEWEVLNQGPAALSCSRGRLDTRSGRDFAPRKWGLGKAKSWGEQMSSTARAVMATVLPESLAQPEGFLWFTPPFLRKIVSLGTGLDPAKP